MVYVIDHLGKPLMPTGDCRKVRLLLKAKKAKVVKRTPFTIQLNHHTKGYRQPVTLGVDAGSKHVGISASTDKRELFAAELLPRNDVSKNLTARREFRRARRSRKTRYRKPRFSNRVHSKHKGWLAPSVEVKIQEHITAIKRVSRILPVTKVRVETAEFDMQLLKALANGHRPPKGLEYQHGEMYGFYNTRQYVLFRDQYTCRVCGKHGAGLKLYVTTAEGLETVSPEDSYTICEHCLKEYAGKDFPIRKKRYWTHPTFMGIMRKTLMRHLEKELNVPVEETAGFITKGIREGADMEKSHVTDALCIAEHPKAARADTAYLIKPVRHHNRQLHRTTILKGGIRKANQAPAYVHGFRLFDKVSYQGQECFVWGRRSSGYFSLRLLDGAKVKDGAGYRHLTLLERGSNYLASKSGAPVSQKKTLLTKTTAERREQEGAAG